MVHHNKIVSNVDHGIYLEGTLHNEFLNNTFMNNGERLNSLLNSNNDVFFKVSRYTTWAGNYWGEPGILPPATDKVVNENLSILLDGWEYNEELTQQYVDTISDCSPVDPIKCNWSVFVKIEGSSFPSDRNLRVYAWPIVPISGWSLISEGYSDAKENIQL